MKIFSPDEGSHMCRLYTTSVLSLDLMRQWFSPLRRREKKTTE
jgi:hypothetical protein